MSALKFSRFLLAAVGFAGLAAHAGGPLAICGGAPRTYASPFTVTLNYDQGPLGSRTNAQAAAVVNNAIALWNNVSTAKITLARGADMPADVTLANLSTYYGAPGTSSDGLNPVIYDSDGSITDSIFGTGANAFVLGFAGSGGNASSGCHYAEGQAVINGKASSSDAALTIVLTHELGHLIGLDHTQLNSEQGLSGANYPLMYPVAYRSAATLSDDDISAITALYPDTNVPTTYGTLQGNFRTAGGTALLGANIWARENTTGKLYSVVSDYLTQGNGFFKMLLPPGTYALHAGAIDATDPGSGIDLTSGSGVGPYSQDVTDLSFQPPFYSAPNAGGSPMTPVVLGNGSPNQIVITAGCVATADFRINGTGSVSGNCGSVTPPPLAPSSGTSSLLNISTRMQVLTGDNVMIAGLTISGSTPKTVAIVATGPSLVPFGITNPLANPSLQLVRQSDSTVIATNDDWQTAPNAAQLLATGFAPTNPLESAILVTLPPGAYTAIVQGSDGGTGVAVVAAYEVDHPEVPFTNISTRGLVLTGNNVMIAGLIIQGVGPQRVIITATGPSLVPFGIANPLPNPTLQLVRSSDSAVIATNDDWQTGPYAAQISASGIAPTNPLESAIMISLDPGAYTAIVSGVGGGTGVSVVGVFTAP